MVRTRIALFSLELSIETSRLFGLLALGCVAVVFGLLAAMIFSLFIVTFFWDTPYRMLAIGLLGVSYALFAIIGCVILYQRLKNATVPFQATLQELERDAHMFDRIRRHAPVAPQPDAVTDRQDVW